MLFLKNISLLIPIREVVEISVPEVMSIFKEIQMDFPYVYFLNFYHIVYYKHIVQKTGNVISVQ